MRKENNLIFIAMCNSSKNPDKNNARAYKNKTYVFDIM